MTIGTLFEERETLSLSELNRKVHDAIRVAFPSPCWVQAETSDVRANPASGHCYLEFVEKHPVGGRLIAKTRGTIWATTFQKLKPFFEQETGQAFASGLKVLVKVTVEYHELYGLSLNVIDIDPIYTLGDMIRRRQEIVRRLQRDGSVGLNKSIPFPSLPQRIAVITSPTAAGYEDFMNQLLHNKAGYSFYTHLFPVLMQGEKVETSIIAALKKINLHQNLFDTVVILRGGGATSELSCFDSYPLASHCARFPLPIVTGIGHERDDTVLDLIAHTRMKTPTAVAEFLIRHMDVAAQEIAGFRDFIHQTTANYLTEHKNSLLLIGNRLPSLVIGRIESNRNLLQVMRGRLPAITSSVFSTHTALMATLRSRLDNGLSTFFSEQNNLLKLSEQFIRMASPDYILRKGYTLTLKEGKIIKRATELRTNDNLTTRFADGEVHSVIH
ncbi:MAG: exodeoxyribonuclease VII large subunit [Tannerellaceae bacterium]|jgi:exodeoxyribonuclease VII large subunit|nr:exodeoxyribonuclease VII large subunit [Tannerellaceae bacterium]